MAVEAVEAKQFRSAADMARSSNFKISIGAARDGECKQMSAYLFTAYRDAYRSPPQVALATDASTVSGEDSLFGACYLRCISKGFWMPIQVLYPFAPSLMKQTNFGKKIKTKNCKKLFLGNFLQNASRLFCLYYGKKTNSCNFFLQETDSCKNVCECSSMFFAMRKLRVSRLCPVLLKQWQNQFRPFGICCLAILGVQIFRLCFGDEDIRLLVWLSDSFLGALIGIPSLMTPY